MSTNHTTNPATPANGSPTWRRISAIAGPMILTNISIPLLGMADTAVLGHLPDPAFLGAVAIGSTLFSLVFWGFGFLRMGTVGFTARAFGRDDEDAVGRHLFQALAIALACSLVLLLLSRPILALGLHITAGSTDVESGASSYFLIRMWGAPLTLMSHALFGWLLGIQRPRATLVMLVTANVVNIGLDFLLVFGFDMGIAGVAIASVVGEAIAVSIGLFVWYRSTSYRLPPWSEVFQLSEMMAMARVNRDIGIRSFLLLGVFGFIPWYSAQLGEVVLAANAVLITFQHLMAYALDGFAHASEALVGQAMGRRRADWFRLAVNRTGVLSFLVAIGFAALYFLGGQSLVGLLTDLSEVRGEAARYLLWMTLLPLVSVWCFWMDGVYVGAGWARQMLIAMLIAVFLVFLPAWWWSTSLNNHGLWLAFTLFMAARGAVMMIWYRTLVATSFDTNTTGR